MKKLQFYLRANAIFSTISGLTFTLQSGKIATLSGLTPENHYFLIFIGIGLILFAVSVFWESRRIIPNRKKVYSIIIADISWVIMSFILILFQLFSLYTEGYILIGIIAGIVGFFAIQQYRSLNLIKTS